MRVLVLLLVAAVALAHALTEVDTETPAVEEPNFEWAGLVTGPYIVSNPDPIGQVLVGSTVPTTLTPGDGNTTITNILASSGGTGDITMSTAPITIDMAPQLRFYDDGKSPEPRMTMRASDDPAAPWLEARYKSGPLRSVLQWPQDHATLLRCDGQRNVTLPVTIVANRVADVVTITLYTRQSKLRGAAPMCATVDRLPPQYRPRARVDAGDVMLLPSGVLRFAPTKPVHRLPAMLTLSFVDLPEDMVMF